MAPRARGRVPRAKVGGRGAVDAQAANRAAARRARDAAEESGAAPEDPKRKSVRRGPTDAGRELATLAGGDRNGWWYWLDELEDSIRAARRFAPDHPAGALQNYVRSETREPHPWAAGETGVIYKWQEPDSSPTPAASS